MKGIESLGKPIVINGRRLSLSKAMRAGNFIFLTGQIPMVNGAPLTQGTIEEQTRNCIEHIQDTLSDCGCNLSNVVKSTVWLKDRADFPGFNTTYSEYFSERAPARSALVADFLVDIKVEIECIAYIDDDET